MARTDGRGQRVLGEVLAPARGATTVRGHEGEAVAVTAAHPMARSGRIELRPLR